MHEDDRQWIAGIRAGDGPSLEAMRAVLLRNLRKGVGSRPGVDDAFLEDIAQDSLLKVVDRLDRFEGRSRLATWATAVAVHVAFDELSRRRWRDVSLDAFLADGAAEASPIDGADPANEYQKQTLVAALRSAIDSDLTERQRTALVAELRGAPSRVIAEELGVTTNALYKLTHDARKRIKQRLEAAGYSAEDLTPTT